MVRATLENALSPAFVDEVFERTATKQYTRKLLFSTLVRLMGQVVCRARTSLHAAILGEEQLEVKAKSVYNKLNGAETPVCEAIVFESAQRMAEAIDAFEAPLPAIVPGYRTRILDGNHLAATEHRPAALRTIGGGALPGVAIVVFDAERGMISRLYLQEDGHAQERDSLVSVLADIESGELWIGDRNFATAAFMLQTAANKARFLVRRHAANGRIEELGPLCDICADDTCKIREQPGRVCDEDGTYLPIRIIHISLATQTRDGDQELSLLTNLPADVSAQQIAEAYRQRWRIETAFAELDRVFAGEIPSLAQPKAALLAFSLSAVAFNVLAVVQAALRKKHGVEKIRDEFSTFHFAEHVRRSEMALEIFLDDSDWEARFASRTPKQIAHDLLSMVEKIKLARLRKFRRGPKKPQPPRKYDKRSPHFSTAAALAAEKTAKPRRSKKSAKK